MVGPHGGLGNRPGAATAWPGRKAGAPRWDYTAGLFTLSLLKLNEPCRTRAYVEFAESTIGSFITPDGTIQGYKAEDYNSTTSIPARPCWRCTG